MTSTDKKPDFEKIRKTIDVLHDAGADVRLCAIGKAMYVFWDREKMNDPISDHHRNLLAWYKRAIDDLKHDFGDGDSYRRAVVIVSAIIVGPFVDRLVDLTRYPRDFVAPICSRMEESGLWAADGTVCVEWRNDDFTWNEVALVSQMLVADGRAFAQFENGRGWVFCAVPTTPKN